MGAGGSAQSPAGPQAHAADSREAAGGTLTCREPAAPSRKLHPGLGWRGCFCRLCILLSASEGLLDAADNPLPAPQPASQPPPRLQRCGVWSECGRSSWAARQQELMFLS
jgi:hypothetical protein